MEGEGLGPVKVQCPRIGGFMCKGFWEIDHSTKPISFDIKVPRPGVYAIDLTYANGNGPVNTENKCAIRTIFIDGQRAGAVVMPHRGVGNWSDCRAVHNNQFLIPH